VGDVWAWALVGLSLAALVWVAWLFWTDRENDGDDEG
jgi:hypothetical protein